MPQEMHDELVEILSESTKKTSAVHRLSDPDAQHRATKLSVCHLIHFLELKVIMDDYEPGRLLSPSTMVDMYWHDLILETRL